MTTLLTMTLLALAQREAPTNRTWDVDGTKREALVYAPSKKTVGKVPLVFDFHGHGGTAAGVARRHHIQSDWPEAVVVYMQGLKTPGKITDPEGTRTGWQTGPGDQKDRDLKFFDAVLASMKKDYPIDEKRIYSTGHSNGGAFTYLLWAERGDTFAAFAPVAASAGLYLKKAKPRPLFHIGSKKDPLVAFAWQERTMDFVKKLNGCDEKSEKWATDCVRYPSRGGTPLVVYLHDDGHKYPAAAPNLITKFFKEHVKK